MSHADVDPRFVTEAEYLAMSAASPVKLEWYSGVVVAMSGARAAHLVVTSNLVVALDRALGDRPCHILPSDARVAIPSPSGGHDAYLYADVTLVCGDLEEVGPKPGSIANPVVLFEVLSDSTERRDRVYKFDLYTTIPSVRAIVLVDPEWRRVEVFERTDTGGFALTVARHTDDRLRIGSLDLDLDLAVVFRRLEKVCPPPREPPEGKGLLFPTPDFTPRED
jgi:Uma2 family endonuclease